MAFSVQSFFGSLARHEIQLLFAYRTVSTIRILFRMETAKGAVWDGSRLRVYTQCTDM